MNSVEFERVLQKLLMRLVWNLLEYFNIYIHLDVNSDVNSQPFFMYFCRYHRLELRQLPSKFGGIWLSTSKVINAKHWANVVTTSAERFSLISQSILNCFTCNFAHTIRSHCGDCHENLVRFDRVFQKLLMWCTETTLFPHRQSAENAGRHWNKWNESGFRPPLCTYRLNWARRTSWGWWDDWDDTVLQTQDSKFEPWRSEAEHATSRSRRLPTILTFTRGWGRNIFVSFKPPRPGSEPRTLAWKAAVLTTTLGPPPPSLKQHWGSALPPSYMCDSAVRTDKAGRQGVRE